MIDVSKINWAFVKQLADRGIEMDALMRDIAQECHDLTVWGKDNGFTEEECFDVLWPILRVPSRIPISERFVETRRQLAEIMVNRPKM